MHIPYKGAAPAVIDLVAGRVDMMFVGVLPSKAHLAAGSLRPLAVTSRTRMQEVPDAPTMAEAGHPDVNTDFVWFGLMAPAKTPDATVRSLHELFAKAVTSPEVRDKLAAQGISVESSTPAAIRRAHQGRLREVRPADQGLRRREVSYRRNTARSRIRARRSMASARPIAVFGCSGSGSASCRPTVVTAPSVTVCATSDHRPQRDEVVDARRAAEPLGEIVRQTGPGVGRDRP